MEYLQQIFSKFFGSGIGDDYAAFCSTPKKIVSLGHVLLDHTAHLEYKSLLERYQLEEGAQEIDSETLQKLIIEACADATDTKCVINPGGSALNTVRILKILGTDSTFLGAVGNDENGEKLKEILKERCIDARLQTIDDCPTGLCICLVKGDKNTLIANIGASSQFSKNFLKAAANDTDEETITPSTKGQTLLRPIEQKQVIYIEGFFVPQHEDICDYIIKNFIHGRRRLAINLSAPYIVKQNYAEILHLAQHSLFIFGNEQEFMTLTEQMGCTTIDETANRLLQDGAVARIVVITKGGNGVDLITNFIDEQSPPGDILFQSFNVPRVHNVVDPTGAGDAFVAGFLHAWLEKRSLTECIRVASDIAARVCTQIGCNLPQE